LLARLLLEARHVPFLHCLDVQFPGSANWPTSWGQLAQPEPDALISIRGLRYTVRIDSVPQAWSFYGSDYTCCAPPLSRDRKGQDGLCFQPNATPSLDHRL
jgi:hypothetical protein